jgi:hypothetical protein
MPKKSKVRIVERTSVDGSVKYVIQQKHFLFRWWWVDAWVNSLDGAWCTDSFDSLEEAQQNLCYFDGSVCKEEVVR